MDKLNEKRSQLQQVTDKLQALNDEFAGAWHFIPGFFIPPFYPQFHPRVFIIPTFSFLHFHPQHIAPNLEKSAISKVQKHIIFKNGKKSIFGPEKSLKIAFLVVLNFFLVQKLIFCHF